MFKPLHARSAIVAVLAALSISTPGSARTEAVGSPAGPDALAPRLTATTERLYLSWLEPVPGDEGSYRLRVAWRGSGEDAWSEPVTIREGSDFFANWADVPGVAVEPGGTLVAWWLQRLGEGTYSYGVRLARSTDQGKRWEDSGWLHDDTSPSEHGFVSMVPSEGGLRAFWLDGREMQVGEDHSVRGAMTLRTALVREGRAGSSHRLDERTCECCDTDAATTTEGPVVVYRDRTEAEIRDVSVVRSDGEWTAPSPVHDDGWKIAGCPVNGPAVAAEGDRVGVVWFTAAGETSRVRIAFSSDGGASFAPPTVVDERRPIGRVGAVPAGGGDLWITWLARAEGGGELRLARVGPTGLRGEPRTIAGTSAERSAGVPSLAVFDGAPWVAWVDEEFGESARLRVSRVTPDQAGLSSTNRK